MNIRNQVAAEMASAKRSLTSRFPPEITLEIIGHLPDVDSILSLRLVNHGLNNLYLQNTRTIFKHVLTLIEGDPITLHIAVMASKAGDIDHRDRHSVESFLQQFLSKTLPDDAYTLLAVNKLRSLIRAGDILLSNRLQPRIQTARHPVRYIYTVTERRRLYRAFCMIEIGGKIFHGKPSGPSAPTYSLQSPFRDLEERYWRAFSKAEISHLFFVRQVADVALSRGKLYRQSFPVLFPLTSIH